MSEPLSPALDPSTPDTSSAVPDPSAPPKASEASADSKVTLTTEIGMAHAETIIGNIFQFPSGVVSFSIDSAKEVTAELAQTTEELFVGEKRLIDEALADLAKQRILLLAGSPGSGRLTTAIYLAGRTATQHRLRSTLVVGALAQNVDVDIWKTAEDAKHFGRRTTIFSNALRHGNGELLRFFTTNGAVHWEQLTKTLTASEAYLIFTAEPGEIANFRPQCSEGLVCRDLTPLGSDLAGRGLDLRASWMHQRERLTDEQFRQITKNRETLRTTLKSLGQITRFLAQYEHSELAVEDALRRFNDIPFWFSTDLSRDVDAWCLATTLALASKAGQSSSAGWWELERIRRAVTEQIKEDRELFPERRSPDSQPGLGETRESKTSGQWLTDDALLLRARAEVVKDPSRLGDTVAFADRTYADAIWPALVARHRRVLTAILPALRSVVEDERGPGSYAVRSLAAQMIGMIGELDPFAISLPLVQRDWVDPRGGSQQLRPFVGWLVQGIRACRNRNYSLAALGALDTLIADDFGDGASTERMLTAISSYSLIGEQEMSLAMERLGRIATEYLAPVRRW
jgi:hypothetical protein